MQPNSTPKSSSVENDLGWLSILLALGFTFGIAPGLYQLSEPLLEKFIIEFYSYEVMGFAKFVWGGCLSGIVFFTLKISFHMLFMGGVLTLVMRGLT